MIIPSTVEILRHYLRTHPTIIAAAPAGVVVGPASFTSEQQGVIVLTEGGHAGVEKDLPLLRTRIQIRILAKTVEQTETIGRAVYDVMHGVSRCEMWMPSANRYYLVHSVLVNGGPTTHRDSDVNWEVLMFVEVLIGLDNIKGVVRTA